jgi:hypothetical protein
MNLSEEERIQVAKNMTALGLMVIHQPLLDPARVRGLEINPNSYSIV